MIMSHYFMSLWYPLELGTFLIFWRKASLTHMVKSVYGRKINTLNFLPVNLYIFPYSKKIKGTICHGLGWREVCSCTARGLGSLCLSQGSHQNVYWSSVSFFQFWHLVRKFSILWARNWDPSSVAIFSATPKALNMFLTMVISSLAVASLEK